MSREGGVISNELLIKVLFGALHLCLPYGGQGSKYWGHLFPTYFSFPKTAAGTHQQSRCGSSLPLCATLTSPQHVFIGRS